jgi:hypothetical protein
MAKKIVNKSVSFNVAGPVSATDEGVRRQYPNFSAYIKRLIQRDMEGGNVVRTIKKAPAQAVTNLSMTQLNGIRL